MSELKPGYVWIEVISGAEGPCLSIGDDRGGYRIAGPKPWGGGRTIHKFKVKASDLVREASSYLEPEQLNAEKSKAMLAAAQEVE